MKGLYNLQDKFISIGLENIFISEISLAELKFGVENSNSKVNNKKTLDNFLKGIQIIPIFNSLDFYAAEKARLRKLGVSIDDFDLLIGATAASNQFTLVTNNIIHLKRIKGIQLENWIIS